MYSIKLRAYRDLRDKKQQALRCAFFSVFMRLCALGAYAAAASCFFSDARRVLLQIPILSDVLAWRGGKPAAWLLLLFGVMYSVCARMFSYAFYAVFTNRETGRAVSLRELLRPRAAFRYLRFRLQKTAAVLRLLFTCFAPPLLLLLLLASLLLTTGLPATLYRWGLILLALQSLFSAVVFFVLSQQFSMTLYLLCLNPLLSVSDALFSSALLTEKRLTGIALLRLRTLPLRAVSALLFFLPFPRLYLAALSAAANETLYGERTQRKQNAAVVFYIDKRSVFQSGEKQKKD